MIKVEKKVSICWRIFNGGVRGLTFHFWRARETTNGRRGWKTRSLGLIYAFSCCCREDKIKGQNYKRDQCRKIRDLKGKLSGLITTEIQLQHVAVKLACNLVKSNNRESWWGFQKLNSSRPCSLLLRLFPCDSLKLTWTPYDLLSAVQENLNWNPRYRWLVNTYVYILGRTIRNR